MALRYFQNGPARSLAGALANATDTSITVDNASGFPSQFPYTLIIDPNQPTEEVVDVTAAVGNILTIVRGVDSTTAIAHSAGAVVWHGVSARDHREANAHVNATTNIHGRTGSLLDTDTSQTISGLKDFTGGLRRAGSNVVDESSTQTILGAKTFSAATTFTSGFTASGAVELGPAVSVATFPITGAWTAYTPTLTSSGTAPTGMTYAGAYVLIGKLCIFRFKITLAATVGTGSYSIALPVAGNSLFPAAFGWANLFDTSAGTLLPRTMLSSGGSTTGVLNDETGTRVGATTPFTFAAGDIIAGFGSYEAA